MSIHLKNAIAALDTHIGELTNIRDSLQGHLNPERHTTAWSEPTKLEPGDIIQDRGIRRQVKRIGGGRAVKKKAPRVVLDLSPMSKAMLDAGRKIAEPFNSVELSELARCERKDAGNAITRWKIKGWISKQDYGRYVRTEGFGDLRTESAEEAERKSPAPTPEPSSRTNVTTAVVEDKLTPYSTKGIAVGERLKSQFSMEELSAVLPQGKQQAYYFVAQWRNKGWVEKEDFDVYRKTKTFGT